MIDFLIVGGCLKIQKSVFAQEMFVQKSLLRLLMNWKSAEGFTIQHPSVGEEDENGRIAIHFNNAGGISIGDDPGKLLGDLKRKYKGKVRGKLVCRGFMSAFTIDLDSDDENIQYIM